jgi:hypothetical protein
VVFDMLATSDGRMRFWAESAEQSGKEIAFVFPDGSFHRGLVLEASPPSRFAIEYVGGTRTTFDLTSDGGGGTDLTLTDEDVRPEWFDETNAGWVSVLMALKAAVDYGVDLRNHDAERTWDQGFVDN